MTLFIGLSCYWLWLSFTARRTTTSALGTASPGRSLLPSQVAAWAGAVGVALTVAALLGAVLSITGGGRFWSGTRRGLFAVSGLASAAVNIAIFAAVTRHGIASAGVFAGESITNVLLIALAQIVMVVMLAWLWRVLIRISAGQDQERGHPRFIRPLATLGMGLTCLALIFWALSEGHTLGVNATWITGRSTFRNTGSWWPGLFAAMGILYVTIWCCSPGLGRAGSGSGEAPRSAPEQDSLKTAVSA